MDKSFEGTAFILGLVVACIFATAIPDSLYADDMRRANSACLPYDGLVYASKRSGLTNTVFAVCKNGTLVELP
jgi:hypothetical protein